MNNIVEKQKSIYLNDSSLNNEIKKYVDKCIEKNIPVIFDLYHFSDLLGIKYYEVFGVFRDINNNYYNFQISKKSGGKRDISMPKDILNDIQKFIKEHVLDNIPISLYAYGFVKGKNIYKNAERHCNKDCVLNIDFKDFFPSIDGKRVYYIFNELCGYNEFVSLFLSEFCLLNNSLPQGASTSPVISNIVTYKLDLRLSKFAKKSGFTYSRYADDITFSGGYELTKTYYLNVIKKIINEEGFIINPRKLRYQRRGRRQEVTGLIVNNLEPSISKLYIIELRQELYYINKFGISEHKKNKGFINNYYKEHILGKILFIKSINEELGRIYLDKFNQINWDY